MLTYMSLEHDSQPKRSAKLKALKEYFRTSDPKAFAMLDNTALSPANKDRGDTLVINSHGNGKVFAGYDAQQFFDQLSSKGFANESFQAVYLMACKVGEQAQDNSILNNFAKDLKRILSSHDIDVKLYAPRGILRYKLAEEHASEQTWYKVTEMFIASPERNYPLSEGMLLVV